MIIEIRESGRPETTFKFETVLDLGDPAVRISEAVKVSGLLRSEGERVEVEGHIEGAVDCECVRCLKPVRFEAEFPFRDVFVTVERFESGVEAEVGGDELDVSVFDGERLDLADVAREQILLFLPEQIFCSEGCRGLCPKCGTDLNLKNCDCAEPETDPRWAGLKDFRS